MRSGGGLLDLPPGAEALVGQAVGDEPLDSVVVASGAGRLPGDRPVPVQSDGGQVGELAVGGTRPHPIQILHPDHESAFGGPGEKPGDKGCSVIADMQIAGRAGREPTAADGGLRHRSRPSVSPGSRSGTFAAGPDPAMVAMNSLMCKGIPSLRAKRPSVTSSGSTNPEIAALITAVS